MPRFVQAILLLFSCVFGLSVGTELSFVTCGSVIKLLNLKHNVRLHSHDVRYGSGKFVVKTNLFIHKHSCFSANNNYSYFPS